jgi:hypothetical protein
MFGSEDLAGPVRYRILLTPEALTLPASFDIAFFNDGGVALAGLARIWHL